MNNGFTWGSGKNVKEQLTDEHNMVSKWNDAEVQSTGSIKHTRVAGSGNAEVVQLININTTVAEDSDFFNGHSTEVEAHENTVV